MIRVPGAHHQQTEVTPRHSSRNNPQVTNQHPAGNQPQVAVLVQQVPRAPQGQETGQIRGIERISQLIGVLQAQEEKLVERLTFGEHRLPRVAGRCAGTQEPPGTHASD